jgi:hypothetical protein
MHGAEHHVVVGLGPGRVRGRDSGPRQREILQVGVHSAAVAVVVVAEGGEKPILRVPRPVVADVVADVLRVVLTDGFVERRTVVGVVAHGDDRVRAPAVDEVGHLELARAVVAVVADARDTDGVGERGRRRQDRQESREKDRSGQARTSAKIQ